VPDTFGTANDCCEQYNQDQAARVVTDFKPELSGALIFGA